MKLAQCLLCEISSQLELNDTTIAVIALRAISRYFSSTRITRLVERVVDEITGE